MNKQLKALFLGLILTGLSVPMHGMMESVYEPQSTPEVIRPIHKLITNENPNKRILIALIPEENNTAFFLEEGENKVRKALESFLEQTHQKNPESCIELATYQWVGPTAGYALDKVASKIAQDLRNTVVKKSENVKYTTCQIIGYGQGGNIAYHVVNYLKNPEQDPHTIMERSEPRTIYGLAKDTVRHPNDLKHFNTHIHNVITIFTPNDNTITKPDHTMCGYFINIYSTGDSTTAYSINELRKATEPTGKFSPHGINISILYEKKDKTRYYPTHLNIAPLFYALPDLSEYAMKGKSNRIALLQPSLKQTQGAIFVEAIVMDDPNLKGVTFVYLRANHKDHHEMFQVQKPYFTQLATSWLTSQKKQEGEVILEHKHDSLSQIQHPEDADWLNIIVQTDPHYGIPKPVIEEEEETHSTTSAPSTIGYDSDEEQEWVQVPLHSQDPS